MALAVFGPGAVYLTRTDIANGTPINIGFAQEFSIDASYNTKQLFGQNQYPLDSARGEAKTSGKIKAALVSGLAINAAFFGQTFTTGSLLMAIAEPGTVPAMTTYTVTVTHSANYDADLGVIYSATGLPFTKVASGPTVGQYSVAAGVYTFAAADASAAVLITYAYTATGGQKLIVGNQPIGTTPTFQLDYATSHKGLTYYIRVFQAISSKFTQQFKLSDYMIPELDFEYFANAAGNVVELSFSEVS
ncbi:MAG: hypothetical protein JWL84_589 [Rhodospirillales bacterium]|nr:hypothetical protein [Rhodospirillales bacterium]